MLASGTSLATVRSSQELVGRPATLPAGEAMALLGAGGFFRAGARGLTVGNLEVRYGVTDRVELRLLLPGLAVTAIPEGRRAPALFFFGGLVEVGFDTTSGGVLAYEIGAGLSKRIHDRISLHGWFRIRHRPVGGEHAELTAPGPLPASRAAVPHAEARFQLLRFLAGTAGLGYAAALGAGRSFGYGTLGVVGTLGSRADLSVLLCLEESRGARPIDPALFGGIGLRF
jgi:hypothetical protein